MGFFTSTNERIAAEIISRYPKKRSAMIPLLHLAQEQEGWVTGPAMEQIAGLTGTTPAEVLGTGSFYEMFKFHPVGRYLINVCTNISCQLVGGEALLEHVARSGAHAGTANVGEVRDRKAIAYDVPGEEDRLHHVDVVDVAGADPRVQLSTLGRVAGLVSLACIQGRS